MKFTLKELFHNVVLVTVALSYLPLIVRSQPDSKISSIHTDYQSLDLLEVNPPQAPFNTEPLVITGARLIDGTGGDAVDNSVVVIDQNRIVAIGKSGEVEIPENADHLDASGYTLLPGLIDAHLHSVNDNDFLYTILNNGTTTFRDPGHPFRFFQSLKFTTRPLPRAFLTGAHFDGFPAVHIQQAVMIENVEHAREMVYDHVRNGSSGIKLYFRLPLEYYETITRAADLNHIPVFAHLELVNADDAIRAGLDGIEHVTSCGTALADPGEARKFRDTVWKNSGARREWRYRLWSTIDLQSDRVNQLIDLMASNNVFLCPTLAVFERQAGDEGVEEYQVKAFSKMKDFVGMAHEGGVKIVTGSHTSGPHAPRGMAYQREMELLVESGMSPMEVIQSSTLVNAHYFRTAGRLGSIEKGKLADLILIQGNPLENISDMKNVSRVMLNGKWIK